MRSVQKMWSVPPELRTRVRGALAKFYEDRSYTDYSCADFQVKRHESGRIAVQFSGFGRGVLIEGRTELRSIVEWLGYVTEYPRVALFDLRVRVEMLPQTDVEMDEGDLVRMAGALEEMYGHRIKVTIEMGEHDGR